MRSKRRYSREMALQVLCQIDMASIAPEEALRLYYELASHEESTPELQAPSFARPFAEELIHGVFYHHSELDELLASASDNWRLERMSVVDRNVLRLALYEMLYCKDIPPKVSINEAIDLGKSYGTEESGAFINGVLDHLLSKLREEGKITKKDNPSEP